MAGKYAFIIVDCSGSMNIGGMQKIGQLNDLLRALVGELYRENVLTGIVTYSDAAEFYKPVSLDGVFYEIMAGKFCGRSNLGKAYELISNYIKKNNVSIADCTLMLISDGSATDNYLASLKILDGKNESKRIAFSISSDTSTLRSHVQLREDLLFKDERSFIAKASNLAS